MENRMFTAATTMTDEMVDVLVGKLNEAFNVPFVGEETEGRWIKFIVLLAKPYVPGWVLQAMGSAANGITEQQAKELEDLITTEVNKVVNIRWVPEPVEETVIRKVVAELLSYALPGKAAV